MNRDLKSWSQNLVLKGAAVYLYPLLGSTKPCSSSSAMRSFCRLQRQGKSTVADNYFCRLVPLFVLAYAGSLHTHGAVAKRSSFSSSHGHHVRSEYRSMALYSMEHSCSKQACESHKVDLSTIWRIPRLGEILIVGKHVWA